jgi:hypothetical protein
MTADEKSLAAIGPDPNSAATVQVALDAGRAQAHERGQQVHSAVASGCQPVHMTAARTRRAWVGLAVRALRLCRWPWRSRKAGATRPAAGTAMSLRLVSGLPQVTIQVVPFGRGGHAAAGGSFTILRFAEQELPDIVYIEQLTSALYPDDARTSTTTWRS